MLENDGSNLLVTKFGSRVSQLYIDPLSAVILRNGLKSAETFDLPPTEISVLHLIATTPDVRNLYLRQKDMAELQRFLMEYTDEFLVEVPEEWDPQFEFFLMRLKTALLLNDWISEKPEEAIITRFKTGSGDIVYLTDNAKWLLYATLEIAKLFDYSKIRKTVSELHIRVANGIKKELVPLVKLRGIGRIRARLLYNNGYKSIAALRKALPRDLARIPSLGPELARSIREQVGNPVMDEELDFK